jgi:hypothetical protein
MQSASRHYAIVTAAYWGFTLTDGALRMLILLHFYRLGYSPFTLAFLFLLYEAAGILANLIGGWLATRYGITRMLTVGLVTQIIGFTLLSQRLRCCQGPHQNGEQISHQGHCRASQRAGRQPTVQMGGMVHRQQKCHEGCGLFPGRFVAGVSGL